MPKSVDLAVLAVMLISGVLALFRGFVREVLSVVAWAGAGAVALWSFFNDKQWLRVNGFLSVPPEANVWATSIALFIAALIVLWLIAGTIGHAVRSSALGSVDRSLGFLFGLARGAIILIGAYLVAWGLFQNNPGWQPYVLDSLSGPPICVGAERVAKLIGRSWVAVPACPGAGQTALDGILNTSPAGRAIDPPIHK